MLLNLTSTIAWSTIWSVYPQDVYFGNGLMYAMSLWSGHYDVNPSIWTSAHHCRFMSIGWHLLHGGSSYVPATSPDKSEFTLVLETLQGNCLRCQGGQVYLRSECHLHPHQRPPRPWCDSNCAADDAGRAVCADGWRKDRTPKD